MHTTGLKEGTGGLDEDSWEDREHGIETKI